MIDACGELKLLSSDLHKRAESTAFIQKLLRCKAGRENYLTKTLDWIATTSHWPAPVVGACHALVDELKPHCNGLES